MADRVDCFFLFTRLSFVCPSDWGHDPICQAFLNQVQNFIAKTVTVCLAESLLRSSFFGLIFFAEGVYRLTGVFMGEVVVKPP